MKASILRWCLVIPCLALSLSIVAHAATISATFTYTGTGTYNSATATGSGSFTITGTTLTAFSFTDTIKLGAQSETYSYALSDVATSTIAPGATSLSNLVFQLTTKSVAGSAPNPFGSDAFTLLYSAASPGAGSTSGSVPSGVGLSGFTTGSVLLTPSTAAVTPEPTSLVLLGTGLVGLASRELRRKRAI